MKTVKIPVKGMSVGELIDSVMAGGEYYIDEEVLGINGSGYIYIETWCEYGMVSRTLSLSYIDKFLDDGEIYQLKTSEDYVAELLNNWLHTTKPYSMSEGSNMIVKFLEDKGFLTLPEGEV